MDKNEKKVWPAKPDSFWNKVYLSVVIVTTVVVSLLWSFSIYFR